MQCQSERNARRVPRLAVLGADLLQLLTGHVQNGVVVFDTPNVLPDGTAVHVEVIFVPPTKPPTRSLLDRLGDVVLHLARAVGAGYLATEDQRLAQVCLQVGLTPESPLNAILRQQVAAWEAGNLAVKGLARVLHCINQWLGQSHPQAGQDFWTNTGAGTHLP